MVCCFGQRRKRDQGRTYVTTNGKLANPGPITGRLAPIFGAAGKMLNRGMVKRKRKEMAGHRVAHATLKGPSVVKELIIGMALGLAAGGLWKMHHWNKQRKTRAFYDLLEREVRSVSLPLKSNKAAQKLILQDRLMILNTLLSSDF
ncbi:unnamed protein product [Brassica napus]|nr:unnamed protein product [Brassica napus]